jgi:hypothetical protein
VLFRRGQDTRVGRLAASLAGVNAHVNLDLTLALVKIWARRRPPTDGLIHPDYLLANRVLYEEMPALRKAYSASWLGQIDVSGSLDDWCQRVLVSISRGLTWETAAEIWPLREDVEDFARVQLVLDRAVAYTGEWILAKNLWASRWTTARRAVGLLFRRSSP